MENIVVYPKDEKQKELLKKLLKEMRVNFKVEDKSDDTLFTEEEFIKKIDKAIQQAESGKTITLSKNEQKEFLGL